MTDVELVCTAASMTTTARPTTRYGNSATVTMSQSSARAFFYASLAGIPANATITSARFVAVQHIGWPARNGRQLTLQRMTPWSVATLTQTNQGATQGAAATLTNSAATKGGNRWSFDVTDLVAAALASRAFYARIISNDPTAYNLTGATFPTVTSRPRLLVSYETSTPAPEQVAPNGGATGTRTPVISWLPWTGETTHQVQVSSSPTFATVDYDSGTSGDTISRHSLAGTSYQLPADGTHAFIRAKRTGPLGTSNWSAVAETWYAPKLTVTITSPGETTSDGSPPIVFTVAGGTQRSFRAQLLQAGRQLWTSPEIVSADVHEVQPPPEIGITAIGATAEVRVDVTDDELRVATIGDPVTATGSRTFTLATSSQLTPVDDLEAHPDHAAPWADFTWSWGQIPDGWALVDADTDTIVDRFAGLDSNIAGAAGSAVRFTHRCYLLAPNRPRRLRIAPISNGVIGAGGNVVTTNPVVKGLWLVEPATGDAVQILGSEEPDSDEPSTVVTSSPIGLGYDVVRQLNLRGKTVPFSGILSEQYGRVVEDQYATLQRFKRDAPPLRFVWALINIPVVTHSIVADPVRAGVSPTTQRWRVKGTAVQQNGA